MSIPLLVMLLSAETMLKYVGCPSLFFVLDESVTQQLSLSSVNFWISSLNVTVQTFILECHNIISSGHFFHFLSFRF